MSVETCDNFPGRRTSTERSRGRVKREDVRRGDERRQNSERIPGQLDELELSTMRHDKNLLQQADV